MGALSISFVRTIWNCEGFGRFCTSIFYAEVIEVYLKWHVNWSSDSGPMSCQLLHVCVVDSCYFCFLMFFISYFCDGFACLHAEEEPRGLVFFGLTLRSDHRHGQLALWEAAGQCFGQGSACHGHERLYETLKFNMHFVSRSTRSIWTMMYVPILYCSRMF